MGIEALQAFRGRNPDGYFQHLPWEVRQRALGWLHHFCQRWGRDLPPWRFAILVGQAKRLALMSPDERSAWGRSMLAKRGGHAVQRQYQLEGRTGDRHPAHRAAQVSVARRKSQTSLAAKKSIVGA
jgi:hypothetical protein